MGCPYVEARDIDYKNASSAGYFEEEFSTFKKSRSATQQQEKNMCTIRKCTPVQNWHFQSGA